MATTEPLWTPSPERIAGASLTAFQRSVSERTGLTFSDYGALHRWSIDNPEAFWREIWDFCGVIGEPGERVLEDGDRMPGARWFPEARVNFAENLLRRGDDSPALIFRGEDRVRREVSHAELRDRVSRLAQALKAVGVGEGDRVAGYLPNMPEAVIGMLASASLGAVWCSCSPDFGVRGVLDRFGQIEPKVLIAADGYYYNGKTHDCIERLVELMPQLPSVEQLVIVPYTRQRPPLEGLQRAAMLDDFVAPYRPGPIAYRRTAFDHPLYIMFSSGTTGAPKCIVHGVGGTLLQHLKEHRLHTDVKPGDRLFYYTTCSWMMWNWLVSGLAAEATLVLYDGSPFYPDGNVLFDYADEVGIDIFGTSAKYIDALQKFEIRPGRDHRLERMRTLLSTGSPLSPDGYDFVYEEVRNDVCLSSIAGGTDILSCFVLGNPCLPVYRGEAQCIGLGMAVEVWNDEQQPVRGEKGELVCTRPFPSMPVGFWNDPDGSRYHKAYFETYPGVWHHGDFVELTEHDGMIFHGRSDAVLNPGGVRIGTAEIYRQVEQLEEVVESLVIGQSWDNDVRVVLFVRLREGLTLDDPLRKRIRDRIRRNTTPRHVPAKVIQVSDIPRTKSGKIVELAVRNVVHGEPVKNRESLANPECLEDYANIPELSS